MAELIARHPRLVGPHDGYLPTDAAQANAALLAGDAPPALPRRLSTVADLAAWLHRYIDRPLPTGISRAIYDETCQAVTADLLLLTTRDHDLLTLPPFIRHGGQNLLCAYQRRAPDRWADLQGAGLTGGQWGWCV